MKKVFIDWSAMFLYYTRLEFTFASMTTSDKSKQALYQTTRTNRRKDKVQKAKSHIFFQCTLVDKAADIVLEKIEEMKARGVVPFGKEAATQSLLNELYQIKHAA